MMTNVTTTNTLDTEYHRSNLLSSLYFEEGTTFPEVAVDQFENEYENDGDVEEYEEDEYEEYVEDLVDDDEDEKEEKVDDVVAAPSKDTSKKLTMKKDDDYVVVSEQEEDEVVEGEEELHDDDSTTSNTTRSSSSSSSSTSFDEVGSNDTTPWSYFELYFVDEDGHFDGFAVETIYDWELPPVQTDGRHDRYGLRRNRRRNIYRRSQRRDSSDDNDARDVDKRADLHRRFLRRSGTVDSLELTRKRLPHLVHKRTNKKLSRKEVEDHDFPLVQPPRRYYSTGSKRKILPPADTVGLNFRLLRTKDSNELARKRVPHTRHYRDHDHHDRRVNRHNHHHHGSKQEEEEEKKVSSTPPPSPNPDSAGHHDHDAKSVEKVLEAAVHTCTTTAEISHEKILATQEVIESLQKLVEALGFGGGAGNNGGTKHSHHQHHHSTNKWRRLPQLPKHNSMNFHRHAITRHRSSSSIHAHL